MEDATTRECEGFIRHDKPDDCERRIVECDAGHVKIKVDNVEIDASGLLDGKDDVSIDGYDPRWVHTITIKLSVDAPPRLTLIGWIRKPKGDK